MTWRTVAGGLSGLLGSLIWAVSLALYQPFMEPTGFWTDPATGARYPIVASNNTYWPREIREFAILLAFGAVLLICRARGRGIIAGAIAAAVWLGTDLWLDRLDVSGQTMATWLTVSGSAFFGLTALVAVKVSAGRAATVQGRQIAGGTAMLLLPALLMVATPWDEPVQPPDTRIEDALTLLQVGLLLGLLAVAIGLLVVEPFTARQGWAAVALVAIAATTLWLQSEWGFTLGWFLLGLGTAFTVAVTGFRTGEPARLAVVAVVSGATLFLSFIVALIFGIAVGGILTRLAGSPGVNGADTDASIAFVGLAVALGQALLSAGVGAPWPRPRRPVNAATAAQR
jgi:hypothetical protein